MSDIDSVSSVATVSSVSSVSSVHIDGIVENRRAPRNFRTRKMPLELFDDDSFYKRFRLTKETTLYILGLIEENLKPFTLRNQSISSINQLLITLKFYASGGYLINVGDEFNISKATCGRIVHKVSHYLSLLRSTFINMPDATELQEVIFDFFEVAGFPNVCGAIDCTHIRLQSPGGYNAEVFRNRKGWFSLNCQMICDANLRIRDVVVRWPGSTHDSQIYQNSLIRARFENNEFRNCYLLGDSGYACTTYLLTPLIQTNTPAERKYNRSHIKTRNTIERTFGILKRRFPILSLGIRMKPKKAIPIIIATCVLHNIATGLNDFMEPANEETEPAADEEIIIASQIRNNNYAVRNAVIRTAFT